MAAEEQPIRKIEPKVLLADVEEFHKNGYRLVHITCTKHAENSYDLTYGFDKDYKLHSLRMTVSQETEVPSVTKVYWGAFLYENEINELFGVKIKGINLDYGGHFYKKKVKYPFSVEKVDEPCKKE